MAESNETSNDNVFSANDPLDINELASLNEEISNEFIEQLQSQISESAQIKNDGDLFEEVRNDEQTEGALSFNDIDDNFIKKYKAKLQKQQNPPANDSNKSITAPHSMPEPEQELPQAPHSTPKDVDEDLQYNKPTPKGDSQDGEVQLPEIKQSADQASDQESVVAPANDGIESITGGNIVEKPINKDNAEYRESLNYIDDNVNYSKYVIYIDPENKDFIDSLTVKERKNLINRIIKEQDAIALTKRRLNKMQTIIMHIIVAIMTVTLAVPCIYWTINASLEATINNYRTSQTAFGQLYRKHGKIKTNVQIK